MTAEIISVGTELLLGNILNTNAQYLSRELAALGITLVGLLLTVLIMSRSQKYFTARQEGNDLYIVRCHYYFILRRRVLDVLDPHMTVIY